MQLADVVSGRFEVLQQVGTGGMGRVFRARDRASGETVAVKVIADPHGQRPERFVREVELLAELVHPGIVRYIDHGQTPAGELFLVMEWLDGEDLGARLQRGPLAISEAVRLASRVADALGAAHARGIVHRDLKPTNLFLLGGLIDQVKVIDFGIAQREGRSQITQTGTLLGTPGFMAPEQARSHRATDARADVFALGCVLFQCLTGAPPFEGDSPIAVLGQLLFGQVPRVSSLRLDVPEDLDALVAKMLARDPALRPNDGANLAAALAALGSLAHTSAAAPAMRPRGSRATTLTGGERRLFSVVLLGPPAGAARPAPTGPPAPPAPPASNDEVEDAAANELKAALARAIRPFGGHLEPLADGAAIVVLEGDRRVATDQAAAAARCALALRDLVGGRSIAAAMGRADSTVQLLEGDVLARAARLLAPPDPAQPPPRGAAPVARDAATQPSIALDDMIAGLLDARFEVLEDDAGLHLRGERALVQGARTLLGRPTACVGRDWELSALAALLNDCIDESQARAAIVTAAPGMGKSRLAAELIGHLQRRDEPVAIWIGRGDSLRAGATLDLLAQALRDALGIRGSEPLEERRARVRARVAEHVPAAEQKRVAEFLGELVGTPFPNGTEGSVQLRAARQDAQLMSEQMRNAWLDFLAAEAAARPVLLVLEDLHWGDFATVRFIDTALRDRGDLPWMVLALARPEVFEVFPKLWAERQHVQEIRLKELGKKAGERLVRQVLGERVGPDTIERLVERLVRQADGNAFYLEELIRAAADDKAEGKNSALPKTVLAMVESRLAQLPLEARQVLRAASVFGEVCWQGGVTTLLGDAMATEAVGHWLARLVDQEVLAIRPASRFPGERELVFRHALFREGAYETLTDDDRRSGHHLAGEWLERHGETEPMVLAGHFERGGDAALAARSYLRAAEQAFHVLDLPSTLARVALGLRCEPPPEVRFALLGMRCEVFILDLQLLDIGMAAAEELIHAAPRGSVPWAQALAAFYQGAAVVGRIPELLAAIELLRDVQPAYEASGRVAFACVLAIGILDTIGRIAAAIELEALFFTTVRPTRDGDPLARFWWNVMLAVRCAHAHDDPWTALQRAEENLAILEVIGGERNFLVTHLYRGMNLAYLGAFEPAAQALERIAASDSMLGLGSAQRRFSLAWLRADIGTPGALDAAHALARALRDYACAHQVALEEGRGRWVLAEVLRRRGDLDEAERELTPALAMLAPFDQPGARATLAAIHLAQGRTADALATAEDAAAHYTAIGGASMFRGAFVRLIRAEALHASGAHDAACRAIADARARLLAIADRIPDPAYRRSFLENVPENARTLALARAWQGEPAPGA
ncbi:MAG TPA: protein kinase [Kofleriaceae bacterium]|nr:protein kinase [Kofleriaceae bacterium]